VSARAPDKPLIGAVVNRRVTIALPLALVAAALALLLFGPAVALGQAARADCASSSGHGARVVRACRARRHGTHARSKGRKHHAKHAVGKRKKKSKHNSSERTPAASTSPPATCEDASAPIPGGDGSYSCEDGSEPACASGVEPVRSSDGSKLLCPIETGAGQGAAVAICEDESSPLPAGGGSYSCDDGGSEPECEDGSSPTLSSASTLVCVALPATEPISSPVEEFDSDGISMRVSSAS
jgi:hypothetical protein